MKLFGSFFFLIMFLIFNGQTNSYDSLIIGKWEMISHKNTPNSFLKKHTRYYQFYKNGTYTTYEKSNPKIIEKGKWKISNNSLSFYDDSLGYWSNLDYKIHSVNKTMLLLDDVFYYEELAKSTYKKIK